MGTNKKVQYMFYIYMLSIHVMGLNNQYPFDYNFNGNAHIVSGLRREYLKNLVKRLEKEGYQVSVLLNQCPAPMTITMKF